MRRKRPPYFTHILLFLLSLVSTIMVGAELATNRAWFWGGEDALTFADWPAGLAYSLSFLTFLTFHEFGHYLTAIYHKVRTSLPFYIPFYIPGMFNIGSMGAVIRLKQVPSSTRKFFDIGIAGPLAGFVISIFLLVYGFTHLPDKEAYLFPLNPSYISDYGKVPTEAEMMQIIDEQSTAALVEAETSGEEAVLTMAYYHVGTSILFEWLKNVLPEDPDQVPNHFDLIHYPFLFVGYITLFFTALNLLPIGQLDGGHIVYGMFGRRTAGIIARIAVMALMLMGGTGLVDLAMTDWVEWLILGVYVMFLLYVCRKVLGTESLWQPIALMASILLIQGLVKWQYPDLQMNFIWLLYSGMVTRLVGLDHPEAYIEHRVNLPRQILGWLAIAIFILCFTPVPLDLVMG
ncbi:MAG: site-2 protease family protein [Bacteroidia bacterium]